MIEIEKLNKLNKKELKELLNKEEECWENALSELDYNLEIGCTELGMLENDVIEHQNNVYNIKEILGNM